MKKIDRCRATYSPHGGGNFWDDVEAANAALNSRPSDADTAPSIDEIVQQFTSRHPLTDLHGRQLRIIAAETDKKGTPSGLNEISGEIVQYYPDKRQTGRLVIALSVLTSEGIHPIPLNAQSLLAVDMIERAGDAPGSVDVLALCTDDEMRQLMNDAKNAINYHDGTDEERSELIFYWAERLEEELGARIGYDSLLSGYGTVYRLAAEGTVADEPRIDEFEAALGSFSCGILPIDNRWRVVLGMIGKDDDVFFVVPDSSHCSRLTSHEQPVDDLIDSMEKARGGLMSLIQSTPFQHAPLAEQRRMAEEAVADVREMINRLFTGITAVNCTTMTYRAVDSLSFKSGLYSCEEIAKLPVATTGNNEPLQIAGERVEILLPELNELKRPANGIADFPLSDGEPMLLITNERLQLVYLMPFSAVCSLLPVYDVEDGLADEG